MASTSMSASYRTGPPNDRVASELACPVGQMGKTSVPRRASRRMTAARFWSARTVDALDVGKVSAAFAIGAGDRRFVP